jgi:ABC-2 type transport system permease protein
VPRPLQAYTQIFPGRYFVELSRGIFLKGVGAEVLWPQVASLALYAAVMVAMAVWRLRIRAE